MKKKIKAAERKVTTHFKQIPVTVVKKIIEVDAPMKHQTVNLDVESAAEKSDPYIDWKRSL